MNFITLPKYWKAFTYVYFTLCFTDLFFLSFPQEFVDGHNIVKPLIMCSMIYYFISTFSDRKFYKWVLAAFVFSWFGDILLLGQEINELFFVAGLAAFLIAHLCYVTYFYRSSLRKIFSNRGISTLKVCTICFGVLLYAFMYTGLGALKVPVFLYVTAVTIMGVSALARSGRVNAESFTWTVLGAFTFIFSDSVIGYNKFIYPVPFAEVLIMLFYCLAQYWILKGFVLLESKK